MDYNLSVIRLEARNWGVRLSYLSFSPQSLTFKPD